MSDSESDLLPVSGLTFQNENTTVYAKGPNINNANFTNLSFRNNVMTSTMHMSRNFGRSCYGKPSFDQRSVYYRRETSPMSLYSASDMRGRNQSYYHGGMSSQRSLYNGRSRSPAMSMRSMDSNASVSAADIAMAFKNANFNKYDLRVIKEAYNKLMKRRIRKKVEKRRNMRLFLKGYRRKSGYDSGEQASDSSISSNDCKSTTSAMYHDNMSSCRSTKTVLTDFRKIIKESNMYNDCTENFKQNTMKNMFQVCPANSRERLQVLNSLPTSTVQTQQAYTQKERFQNGFLLPSQRFNKSMASVPIPERNRLQGSQNTLKPKNGQLMSNGHLMTQERANNKADSDQDEIFSAITVRENDTLNYEPQYDKVNEAKRNLEDDENGCSNRKRAKLSSPVKQLKPNELAKTIKETKGGQKVNARNVNNNNGPSIDSSKVPKAPANNDFEFIKPQLPVRKSGPGKIKEKLISKSAPPLVDTIIPPKIVQEKTTTLVTQSIVSEEKPTAVEEQPDATQNSTSDLSMRPSFIKRKLFSQTMDVTERKNISNDAINVNSPQTNVYSAIQHEKHKARKLVTNQSCLSRDVAKEDNNLLDLIHKIVPPDCMNVTNATKKTSIGNSLSSKNNQIDEEDKWDVTSVISTCNNDSFSDTYTDEEIFATDEMKTKTNDDKVVKNKNNVNNTKTTNSCKIVVEKLSKNILVPTNQAVEVKKTIVPNEGNDNLKKSLYSRVKSFWDTDFESDVESTIPKKWTTLSKENQMPAKENHNKSTIMEAAKTIKTKINSNISLASVSESIKSKSMPTNNMGKLKLNTNIQLNIKSCLSPKNKLEQQSDEINKQIEVFSKPVLSETEVKTKETKKQMTSSKSKKTNSDTKNKSTAVGKQKITDKIKTTKTTPSTDKAKKDKTTQPSNKTKNSKTSPNKTKSNSKVQESLHKSSDNTTRQSKAKSNISPKSLNVSKANTGKQSEKKTEVKQTARKKNTCLTECVNDKSISARPIRTPKRKSCCNAPYHNNSTKPVTKTSGNPSKKSKLVGSGHPQNQPAKKLNENTKQNNCSNHSNQNKKCLEPETNLSMVYESETSYRTLRSRRIDLSTSINSSADDLTTLNIRSRLRRRIDLSSSLKDSSLDENVTMIKNSRSKVQAKRPGAKPGHAELLDNRRRR